MSDGNTWSRIRYICVLPEFFINIQQPGDGIFGPKLQPEAVRVHIPAMAKRPALLMRRWRGLLPHAEAKLRTDFRDDRSRSITWTKKRGPVAGWEPWCAHYSTQLHFVDLMTKTWNEFGADLTDQSELAISAMYDRIQWNQLVPGRGCHQSSVMEVTWAPDSFFVLFLLMMPEEVFSLWFYIKAPNIVYYIQYCTGDELWYVGMKCLAEHWKYFDKMISCQTVTQLSESLGWLVSEPSLSLSMFWLFLWFLGK